MKVLYIISLFDLFNSDTAAGERMRCYARSVAISGVKVYFISSEMVESRGGWKEVYPNIYAQELNTQNHKGYNFVMLLKFIRYVYTFISQTEGDVAILNYPSSSSLLFDILLIWRFRLYPVYVEVNEVRAFASGLENSTRNKFYSFLLDRTYSYYKGAIFISRHIARYYSKAANKMLIVPILSNCNGKYRPSLGLDSLDIVFIGTISFDKENLGELLEGFKQFAAINSTARLIFYGTISSKDNKKLKSFMDESKLCNRVIYMGKVNHTQVKMILSNAGALILPRMNNKQNYYGFSTKLSEYAVSGTPIILTNTGVVADYFTDGFNCLMCDGYTCHSFKEKFIQLARMSTAEKEILAFNAYETARRNFDYRLYSSTLCDFFW